MDSLLLWATAVIWLGFIVYWNASGGAARSSRSSGIKVKFAFGGTKPASAAAGAPASASAVPRAGGSESAASRSLHQLLMWGALLFSLLPWFWPLNERWLPAGLTIRVAGLLIQIAFSLLYIWARIHLGRFWSGAVMTREGHQLIRSGPYRRLRHPMYTAILGMFIGTAMVWGEVHALVGLAMAITTYSRKIIIEERRLRGFFGAEYDDYRRATWALIPGVF